MKKYLLVLPIVIVTLLCVTGCGSKKLVCTTSEVDETVEATVKFKSDEISTAIFKMTFKADSKEDAEEGKLGLDTFMGPTYSEMSGVTYDSELKGTNVIVTVTMDVSKFDEESSEKLLDGAKTYDEIKTNLEKSGYSCK